MHACAAASMSRPCLGPALVLLPNRSRPCLDAAASRSVQFRNREGLFPCSCIAPMLLPVQMAKAGTAYAVGLCQCVPQEVCSEMRRKSFCLGAHLPCSSVQKVAVSGEHDLQPVQTPQEIGHTGKK